MNPKTSTRLRLEHLEKRNLLSAMPFFPDPIATFVPHAVAPPPWLAAEYSQVVPHRAADTMLSPVTDKAGELNALAMPESVPNLTSMSLAPTIDSFPYGPTIVVGQFVEASPTAVDCFPSLTPLQLAPAFGNLAYEQSIVAGLLTEIATVNDLLLSTEASDLGTNTSGPVTPGQIGGADVTTAAPNGATDPAGSLSNQSSAEACVTASPSSEEPNNAPSKPAGLNSADSEAVEATSAVFTEGVLLAATPKDVRHDDASSRDTPAVTGEVTDLTADPLTYVSSSPSFPGVSGPPDNVVVNMQAMQLATVAPDVVIEGMVPNRPAVGIQGPVGRASGPLDSVSLPTDITPVDNSSPPIKQQSADATAISDAIRLGEPIAATVGTGLPASGGVNLQDSYTSSLYSATSISTDSGFVAISSATAVTPPQGSTIITKIAPNGKDGMNQNNWLTAASIWWEGQANPRDSADTDGSSPSNRMYAAGPANEIYAAGVPYQSPADLPPFAESPEGGGIELAISDRPPAVGDDLKGAEGPSADNAEQQASNIRPESDVGLFCDIEVAAAPTMASESFESTRLLDHNAGPLVASPVVANPAVAAADRQEPKSSSDKELTRASTILSKSSLAGLEGQLPLVLAVTLWVSQGGLRVERKSPDRESQPRDCQQMARSVRFRQA
jgi:hypothetical protein